jgi:hypothetical protein
MLTISLFLAFPAWGQAICADRASLLQKLAAEYQEAPIGVGIAHGGSVLELLTSPDGTWTLMATRPGGQTCLIATGQAWQGARCEPVKPEERGL